MFELLLFLHILGSIAAFGFGFAAPIFGSMLAREPQHGNWYMRAVKRISDGLTLPAVIVILLTGIGLVLTGAHRFTEIWLAISIAIYVAALAVVFTVQKPALSRMIELTSAPPGPGGPPAEVAVLSARLRMVGLGLTVAVVVITALMVWKPVI